MWLKYAVSVFRRFSTRYFGICHFFLRYCGIGYPPMSPSEKFDYSNFSIVEKSSHPDYRRCLLHIALLPSADISNRQSFISIDDPRPRFSDSAFKPAYSECGAQELQGMWRLIVNGRSNSLFTSNLSNSTYPEAALSLWFTPLLLVE